MFPALSTPTNKNGELDEEGLRSEVRANIGWGAHGLAVSIIAGEFYKFSNGERLRTFDVAVDEAKGKVPVLAGVSHTGTEPAVMFAVHAQDIGADGVIIMPPFFGRNIPRSAVYDHIGIIASKVDLPVMVQDAEDHVNFHICPTMYMDLAEEYSNIVSVKIEGANTLDKIRDVKRIMGDRLIIFGGMAARLLFEEISLGADGNIPDACLTDMLVEAYNAIKTGKMEDARDIFSRYRLWVDFLSDHGASSAEVEKETLRLRGILKSSQTRWPHVPLGEQEKVELKGLLAKIGIIRG